MSCCIHPFDATSSIPRLFAAETKKWKKKRKRKKKQCDGRIEGGGVSAESSYLYFISTYGDLSLEMSHIGARLLRMSQILLLQNTDGPADLPTGQLISSDSRFC